MDLNPNFIRIKPRSILICVIRGVIDDSSSRFEFIYKPDLVIGNNLLKVSRIEAAL
jgi:hypothetical protein